MRLTDFEGRFLGWEFPSYFAGAGIVGTRFNDIVVGIGVTPREAIDDAIDLLDMSAPFAVENIDEIYAALTDDMPADELDLAPTMPSPDELSEDAETLLAHYALRWNL